MKKHVMTGRQQQKKKKKIKNSVFAEVDVANTRRRTTAEFKTRPSIVLQVRAELTAPRQADRHGHSPSPGRERQLLFTCLLPPALPDGQPARLRGN